MTLSDEFAWMDDGSCKKPGMRPEWWFPERGQSLHPARTVCKTCPVRVECLEFAVSNHEMFGVWGGMSERQRRSIRAAALPLTRICEVCDLPYTWNGKGTHPRTCSKMCQRRVELDDEKLRTLRRSA